VHDTLKRAQVIPRPIDETFAFFADAANLEVITPDWMHFQILTAGAITMRAGTLIEYWFRWRWVPIRWQTEIRFWEPPAGMTHNSLRSQDGAYEDGA